MTQHGMSARSAERKPSPLFELVCVAGSCGTGRTGLFLRKGYARARGSAKATSSHKIACTVRGEGCGRTSGQRRSTKNADYRPVLCALIYLGRHLSVQQRKPIDLFSRGGIRLIIGVSLRLRSHQSNRYAEPLCHRPTVILENVHVNGRAACQ